MRIVRGFINASRGFDRCSVARLGRRDVDWHRGGVIMVGKGNKEREVYMGGSDARTWLGRYFAERHDDEAALWDMERGSHRLSIRHSRGI